MAIPRALSFPSGRARSLPSGRGERRRAPFNLLGGRRLGLWFIVVLLLLWELSARTGMVQSLNWPPVSSVLAAAVGALGGGDLLVALGGTIYRMAVGLALGAIAGIALGIMMATSPYLRRTLEPAIELIRPLPVPALVPPLVLFLGLDDPMKITLVAMTAFFPVLINTIQGALSIEPVYRAVAATFGVSRFDTLRKVLFPATLPYIFAGLRISVGLAFVVAVVAEMIAGAAGIGYYVVSMQYAGRAAEMYAALLLLGLAGYLVNRAFLAVERYVIHWHQADNDD